tara:strand:- start:212 stop:340 length:129 start_codon:yes stop_codon:yes gene_type:complete
LPSALLKTVADVGTVDHRTGIHDATGLLAEVDGIETRLKGIT